MVTYIMGFRSRTGFEAYSGAMVRWSHILWVSAVALSVWHGLEIIGFRSGTGFKACSGAMDQWSYISWISAAALGPRRAPVPWFDTLIYHGFKSGLRAGICFTFHLLCYAPTDVFFWLRMALASKPG